MKSWTLWGIGGLALLALALIGGTTLLGPSPGPDADSSGPSAETTESTNAPSSSPSTPTEAPTDPANVAVDIDEGSIDISVNGEPIAASLVDQRFRDLLRRYQASYREEGRDFSRELQGPSGAYLELEIRYQAAQSAIQREIMEQQAARLGVQPSDEALQEAFETRFQSFLQRNSVTEDELVELYQDTETRSMTRRLLGIDDASVDALKERLRRDARYDLLKRNLAERVLEGEVDLSEDEAEERFNDWLQSQRAEAEITYEDPLLQAHHLEQRISETEGLERRQERIEEAIAAYRNAQDQTDADDSAIDYILGLLYNMRVDVSQAIRDQLLSGGSSSDSESESSASAGSQIDQLDQAIRESRSQASQLLSPFDFNDEEQLRRMMQADSGNPLYRYMFARNAFNDEASRVNLVVRMLDGAIDLLPDYVDAHVLYGDLRMEQGYHSEAIDRYRRALDVDPADVEAQFRTVSPEVIRRKLAGAHIALARSIDPDTAEADALERRRQALDQAEELLSGLRSSLGRQSSDFADVLLGLGDVALLRGQHEQAETRYREALDVEETAEAWVKLGRALWEAGDGEQAEAAYREAIRLDDGYTPAHEGLARLFATRGETERAMDEYQNAFSDSRLSYGERRSIALEALELDSDNLDMRLRLADFYLAQHVYQGALDQYERILNENPQNTAAQIGIARVHLERLDYEQALSALQSVLETDPSIGQQIEIQEWIVKTHQRKTGPGQSLPASGQEAIWRLAQLYQEANQPNESFERLLTLREDYPDFRPDDVRTLMEQAKTSVGDDLPGQPTPNQGSEIIEPDSDHDPYVTTPPTSGPHYVISADWGIHTEPIPDEVQVRNLAGGGVLIQYQPDASDELQTQLRDFVTELRGESGTHCRLILAPYEGLSTPIAVTAWARIDTLSEFDAERIRSFISAHMGKGPEVDQVGCSRPDGEDGE